jgi:hypothetical protein
MVAVLRMEAFGAMPVGYCALRGLRALAKGEEITQDISTLENPAILEQLKEVVK